MNLGEKNYKNLVEAFTKDAIDIAASASSSSSSDPKLSLPSSTLSSHNQSNTYRIENPEYYHNSKGDIADWFIAAVLIFRWYDAHTVSYNQHHQAGVANLLGLCFHWQ